MTFLFVERSDPVQNEGLGGIYYGMQLLFMRSILVENG